MHAGGLVGEALERLRSSGLLAHVLGVRTIEHDGAETVQISVPVRTSAQSRQLIGESLDGLPHECVDDNRPARGVVHGMTGVKDDQTWRMGSQAEVAWIRDHTAGGLAITSAVPPVFDAYATLVIADDDVERRTNESALLHLLAAQSADLPWWLGYLCTGAHDVVFDQAPTVTLYADWKYVLVEAGPVQAGTWREDDPWRGRLPDLIYPADRSWLVSMLWDDDWRCMGGPSALIEAVLRDRAVNAHQVGPDEDATPPGHVAC